MIAAAFLGGALIIDALMGGRRDRWRAAAQGDDSRALLRDRIPATSRRHGRSGPSAVPLGQHAAEQLLRPSGKSTLYRCQLRPINLVLGDLLWSDAVGQAKLAREGSDLESGVSFDG